MNCSNPGEGAENEGAYGVGPRTTAGAGAGGLQCRALRLWSEADRIPSAWGDTLLVEAEGDCMRPFVAGGDQVAVRRASLGMVRVGDIALLIDHHGVPCLHRVIWRRRAGTRVTLLQKADDSPCPTPVPDDGLIGVAAARIRDNRVLRFDSVRARWLARLVASVHVLWVALHRTLARPRAGVDGSAPASAGGVRRPPPILRVLGSIVGRLLPEKMQSGAGGDEARQAHEPPHRRGRA